MDQSTHDIRRAYWLDIINKCNQREEGSTARQWLADNGIREKSYYYWLRKFRLEASQQIQNELPAVTQKQPIVFAEIPVQSLDSNCPMETDFSFNPDAVLQMKGVTLAVSNTISESLLSQLIKGVSNAC